ncbi:MAG: hypothetical protein JO036_12230 [Candidatus Eremiobacteraeota bacterium]|nr:hypothetical protein [Candidatus Eremiobacteraeota bacterium]
MMQSLCGSRFCDVLVEQTRYWETGVYGGDLVERWRNLDFRMVETVPFIKNMEVDPSLGTYSFTMDWHNEFNYAKNMIVALPAQRNASDAQGQTTET